MNDILSKLKKQKETIESEGYKVAYITLYGSQNYGLNLDNDSYKSDVDMKAIVVPTLDDLINNSKPVSKVIKTEWGECDVKDIRNYFETLLKANPTYVETLFTDYYVIDEDFENELTTVRSMREELVKVLQAQFIRSMYGMMCEKEKALCHPYPSIAYKIEKFGYDGKQAHHILRMWILMQDYYQYLRPLANCFHSDKKHIESLMELKLNKPTLEDVKIQVANIMNSAKEFKDNVIQNIDESTINYSIKDKFINLSQKIIKNKIIKQIGDELKFLN